MFEIILSLIKVGNVHQHKIAQGTNIKTKTSSITRRIQRFFAEEFVRPEEASKFIAASRQLRHRPSNQFNGNVALNCTKRSYQICVG